MAIVGIKEQDIDRIWDELGMKLGAAIGLCVRSIKICPGTTFCKRGQQDSVGIGLKLDEKYHGMGLPFKLKMGTSKGYRLYAGGSSGLMPRLGNLIAEGLSESEALEMVDRIISFYKKTNQKKRLGRIIDEIGLDNFKKEIL